MSPASRIDELRKRFEENPRRFFAPLANEYRKQGDLEQAIELCAQHLADQPGNMNGHVVYGQALFDAGRFDEADATLRTAVELDPENLISLRLLGDIARTKGQNADARDWYRRVLDADPRNEEIIAFIEELNGLVTAEALPVPTGDAPVDGASADLPFVDMGDESPRAAVAPTPVIGMPAVEPPPSDAPEPIALVDMGLEFTSSVQTDMGAGLSELAAAGAVGLDAPTADASLSFGGDDAVQNDSLLAASASIDAAAFEFPAATLDDDPLGFDVKPAPIEMPAANALEMVLPSATEPGPVDFLELSPPGEPLDATPSEPAADAAPMEPVADAAPMEPTVDAAPMVEFDIAPAGAVEATAAMPAVATPLLSPEATPSLSPEATPPLSPRTTPAISNEAAPGISLEATPTVPLEATPPAAPPAGFVTETMAELFLKQGFRDQAIAVYLQLVEQRPHDAALADKLRELQADAPPTAPQIAAVAPIPALAPPPPPVPSGPTAREFFAEFARRSATPGAGGGRRPTPRTGFASLELPAPQIAPGGSLDALFGGSAPSANDEHIARAYAAVAGAVEPALDTVPIKGKPTQPAESELSLDSVFREPRQRASGAQKPFARQSQMLRFDQFFSSADADAVGAADAPEAPADASGAPGSPADLEQFGGWLRGLRDQ